INKYLFKLPSDNNYLKIFRLDSMTSLSDLKARLLLSFKSFFALLSTLSSLFSYLPKPIPKIISTSIILTSIHGLYNKMRSDKINYSIIYLFIFLSILAISGVGNGQGFRLLMPVYPI